MIVATAVVMCRAAITTAASGRARGSEPAQLAMYGHVQPEVSRPSNSLTTKATESASTLPVPRHPAQLRSILQLTPGARQAIADLIDHTTRTETRPPPRDQA